MPYQTMTPEEAKTLLESGDGWTYVDVRTVEEYEAGHVPDAYNIPFAVRTDSGMMGPNPDFVPALKKSFPADSKLVLGCAAGGRSRHACEQLMTEGFGNLVNMHGGYSGARDPMGTVTQPGWQALGFPTESSAPPERTYKSLSTS